MAACGGKSQGGENEVDTTQTNFKIFANTSALSPDNGEKPLVKQMNEAVGVTTNGKNYFYQGQPVHIFLDVVRPDRSLYTLQINPAGTVNIKIVRNEENAITGVAYMTDAEVTELLGDLDDPADE